MLQKGPGSAGFITVVSSKRRCLHHFCLYLTFLPLNKQLAAYLFKTCGLFLAISQPRLGINPALVQGWVNFIIHHCIFFSLSKWKVSISLCSINSAMGLDPLSALLLVGTIVQFVDFGSISKSGNPRRAQKPENLRQTSKMEKYTAGCEVLLDGKRTRRIIPAIDDNERGFEIPYYCRITVPDLSKFY